MAVTGKGCGDRKNGHLPFVVVAVLDGGHV
jgi:hypothetical protein